VRAFVFSGAGNRGPIQVGALQALVEAGIQPDFMVGTSAGAINLSCAAALGLSARSVERMCELWREVEAKSVYPESLPKVIWRVARKYPSLYSSDGMRKILQEKLPPEAKLFGDLKVPLYLTAVDLLSNRLFIFGEDPNTPLLDVVMASAAVPVIHPPVDYHGLQLVDGGVLANVAASYAMERGATEIYVINAGSAGGGLQPAAGVLDVVGHTLSTMLVQSFLRDIERAKGAPGIRLHHIHVPDFGNISFRDFSKTDEMIATGYARARAYLAAPAPFLPEPARAPAGLGEVVPGAREYFPSF
jgi:NTE family protein